MSGERRVLVSGATGRVGRHLVAGLLDRDMRVVALVRQPATAALPVPVELAEGDLRRPASVAAAADGANAAFLLWPGYSADGAAEMVQVLAQRVPHVVYLSAARLQDGEEGVKDGVADIEALIERSGIRWTFARAGGFAANTLGWADQIRAGDVVRIPVPLAARSLVDERDLADVVVHVLTDPGTADRAFAVTGPQVLTQRDQVLTIGAATGWELQVEAQPRHEALSELEDQAGPDFAHRALA